jgi:hypothetical protein
MDLFNAQQQVTEKIRIGTVHTTISLVAITLFTSGALTGLVAACLTLQGVQITSQFLWQTFGMLILSFSVGIFFFSQRGRKISQQPLTSQIRSWGGSRIEVRSQSLNIRRAIQIVDELSLAAGIPAPQLFYMRSEPGINAFSVTRNVTETALCVTHGALTELSHSELEALLAYEVFRILRGEAQLGLTLIETMHPLFALYILGSQLMIVEEDDAQFEEHYVYKPNGRTGVVLWTLGRLLKTIGTLPALYGLLLQRRLLHQHTFERDKATFESCRGNEGLIALLGKGIQNPHYSKLKNPQAIQLGPLFFAPTSNRAFFIAPHVQPSARRRTKILDPLHFPPPAKTSSGAVLSENALYRYSPVKFLETIGKVERSHIEHATFLIKSLPAGLYEMTKDINGAHNLVLALSLNSRAATRRQQIQEIEQTLSCSQEHELLYTYELIRPLSDLYFLSFVHLIVPTLQRLSLKDRNKLGRVITKSVQLNTFRPLQQCASAVLVAQLLLHKKTTYTSHKSSHQAITLEGDLSFLLSFLAHSSTESPDRAVRAYCHGAELLGITEPLRPLSRCSARQLSSTLQRLARTTPFKRKQIVHVCAEVLAAEGRLTAQDADILRAIGTVFCCPHGPLVAHEMSVMMMMEEPTRALPLEPRKNRLGEAG